MSHRAKETRMLRYVVSFSSFPHLATFVNDKKIAAVDLARPPQASERQCKRTRESLTAGKWKCIMSRKLLGIYAQPRAALEQQRDLPL